MKKIDKLNGLKAWWNKLCKPQFKITISAEKLKQECLAEYEQTGSVEMRKFYAKDNCTHQFWR